MTTKQNDYQTEEDALELFLYPDSESDSSYADLKKMITHYNPKNEGILVLITDFSNATYFIKAYAENPGSCSRTGNVKMYRYRINRTISTT